jgi:hypothetical protein
LLCWRQGRTEVEMMRFELDTAEICSVDSSVFGFIKLSRGVTLSPRKMRMHSNIAFKI